MGGGGGGEVVDVEPHSFLTLTVAGGEWSSSCSGHCAPAETAPNFKKYFNTCTEVVRRNPKTFTVIMHHALCHVWCVCACVEMFT